MNEREEYLATQDVEARDEARMSDHLSEQQRGWSPGQAVALGEKVTLASLWRETHPVAPAPAAEPSNRGWLRSTLEARGVVLTPGEGQDAIDLVTGKRLGPEPDDVPAPAAEAKGELSEDTYIRVVWSLVGKVDDGTRAALLAHDDALRTRAREAEEQAGLAEANAREHADLLGQFRRERDEAREQRGAAVVARDKFMGGFNTANETITDLEFRLAAANARAEEKEAERVTANEAATDADRVAATERAARVAAEAERDEEKRLSTLRWREKVSVESRLAAAEAEVKRLNAEIARARMLVGWPNLSLDDAIRDAIADDPSLDATDGASPAWWRGCDHGVRKAAESILEALGTPQPDRLTDPIESVRQRVAALRERCRRLEEAGDRLLVCVDDDEARDDWCAAKAEVPNG